MTSAQLTALKAAIVADSALNAFPNNSDGNFEVARQLNLPAAPGYWVWRTEVSRSEIYNTTSDVPSDWDWTIFKTQSVPEQGAWREMFMGDRADFSKPTLRLGIAKIFGAGNANNAHCLALGRRLAKRVEKVLKVAGTGTTADPATMGFEGSVDADTVGAARSSS